MGATGRWPGASRKPLARARQVVERSASRVEIPLPRLIQELERALDIVKITRFQSEDRALAEADDAFLFVHADNRQARLHPLRHRHDFGVGDCVPRLQIAFAEAEACLALRPLRRLIGEFGDGQVALVRMPSASSPLAIDPELPEIPFAVADIRNIGGPQLLAFDRDLLPAAQWAARRSGLALRRDRQ